MLRSAFRGKNAASSTTKDENDQRVMNADGEDLDFQELYETFKGSRCGKRTSNEGGNLLSKSASCGSGANESLAPDHGGKDQRGGFSNSERQIYEMQLAQLQEQLVTTMIDHQDMSCQLKKLKTTDVEKLQKDLHKLQEENRELKEKLKQQKKVSSSKLQRKNASRSDPRTDTHGCATEHTSERASEDWVDLGGEQESHIPSATWHGEGDHLATAHQGQDDSCQLDGAMPEFPGGQPNGGGASGGKKHRVQDLKTKVENWKNKAVEVIVDRLWDFVNDEPEFIAEDEGEGEPLSVKRLKENINRFSDGIKPITSFIKYVGGVFSWSNPTASFLIFVVYMYSVWCGNLLPLLLFTAILKLFYNYLHARGIAKQLGFAENVQEETNTSEDQSWSDKFHLVLQVARKVQNTLGKMADSLEKVKSLFTWQHPEATRKLFTGLCLSCLASLVLRGPTLFMLVGLMLGIKLFIVKAIYRRFPKVKNRYDSISRLWEELPTDAQLAEKESTATHQEGLQRASSASFLPSTSGILSESPSSPPSSNQFAERFRLPSCETPLPDWEDGKRCVLMDKDKPLSHFKHGRLHLTQSYLCFEKLRSSNGKNIVIKLETVTKMSKAKPIGLMPGTGMAVQLHVRGVEKPYVFGGIIGRDEVFENIMATARAANIAWALT